MPVAFPTLLFVGKTKNISRHCQMPLGAKSPLVKYHWSSTTPWLLLFTDVETKVTEQVTGRTGTRTRCPGSGTIEEEKERTLEVCTTHKWQSWGRKWGCPVPESVFWTAFQILRDEAENHVVSKALNLMSENILWCVNKFPSAFLP